MYTQKVDRPVVPVITVHATAKAQVITVQATAEVQVITHTSQEGQVGSHLATVNDCLCGDQQLLRKPHVPAAGALAGQLHHCASGHAGVRTP